MSYTGVHLPIKGASHALYQSPSPLGMGKTLFRMLSYSINLKYSSFLIQLEYYLNERGKSCMTIIITNREYKQ